MATKVEQTSLERRRNQSTASPAAAPATIANSPKISMRSVKAGVSFVIPKNKLSGALVPVVRGGAKVEKNDSKRDDEVKQPQRKTKWGIDLTQDAAVRRGRALAYQTRAEQIAAQLESGNLEKDPDGASRSPSPPPIFDESGQRINTSEARKREQLDLERREAIGECMRLNPNYKPPAGYMPVCKEAKMYIPVKETLGHNIVGLILGPQGNTRKRLEEETGTQIAIKGRVRDTKEEKVMENADLDGKEIESINEELHVHISADSYEKIDAAIALLELLMTPVDGNVPPAGADTASLFGDGSRAPEHGAQVADASHSMVNTNLAPNYAHPMQIPPPGQQPPHLAWSSSAMEAPGNVAWPLYATQAPGHHLQSHPGHWHSLGANNSAMQSHSGVVGPPNTAAYGMNNANMFIPRIPQQAFHPFPPFRGRPAAQGFNMHAVPANVRIPMPGPVNRPRPAFQVQHRPYVEMASQNQSTIMNSSSVVFGPRPPLVIGGSSNSSQAVHHTVPNAAPLPPSSNIIGGGGYGPSLPHGRPASAPLATAVQSHVPVSQPSNGPQQQQLQHSHTTTLARHEGTVMQVSPQVPAAVTPSPVLPSSGSLLAQPQGAHSANSPAVTSHGLFPAAPQGAPPAISSASVSHVLASPRFPQSAPQRPHVTVPPGVVSPIPLSPGLPSPAPRPVHAAFPPPLTPQGSQRPGFSQAPPQSAAVAVPPLIPSPPVPPTGNSFPQPPRMAFMSQGSSVGLSSVALPVMSATHTPASTILSGPMHSTVTNPSGITVATVQSSVASRPGLPPPVPSGSNISSQGSSVSSSAAPNSWQPQHLNSGDFTFQPLRSQAPSPPPAVRPLPSQPPPSEMHSQNTVPTTRPGYPPAGPNLPHSLPGQMRVSVPLPPTSVTSTPLSPPLPPLPPQAPSFRPAISLPSPPLSNSLQPTFSIPLGVSVSQTAAVSPARPNFLGSSQQMAPRPSGVSTSAAIPPFGLSAPHTIRPLPPQPRPQSGPESFHSFPSVPNFQCQEATSSQPFQNLSASVVSIPPHGPPPPGPPPPFPPPPPPRAPPVPLPGNIPNQVGGSSFQQQQRSPTVFTNISAVQASNVKHNHVTTSPQVNIPSHSQVRSIVPGQMYDLGYGGGVSKTLPASTVEGGASQSYDPFSPTSIPPEQLHPQNDQPSNLPSNAGKAQDRQETDAEYENLMESVGVR